MNVSTLFAARTSIAVFSAADDKAWVSFPINNGPLILFFFLKSHIACVIAIICCSLKLFLVEFPLCPDVPKETF